MVVSQAGRDNLVLAVLEPCPHVDAEGRATWVARMEYDPDEDRMQGRIVRRFYFLQDAPSTDSAYLEEEAVFCSQCSPRPGQQQAI